MQWVIITLLIVGWILLKVFEAVYESNSNFQKSAATKKIAAEKFPDRKIDSSLDLYERNKDIIEKHLESVSLRSSRFHYVDDATRDCINEICLAERQTNLSPEYKYLSSWISQAPKEWVELAERIKKDISVKRNRLQEVESAEKKRKTQEYVVSLTNTYADLLTQFNEVAYRKVTTIDDYGEENWDILDKEADILIAKIARKEGKADGEIKEWKKFTWRMPEEFSSIKKDLISSFKAYYSSRKSNSVKNDDVSKMSGVEFENHIAALLQENGFANVAGTPKTGDQGADLICKRGVKKIVIQAKRHAGTVGNKAVQEVIGAIRFYDADEGWVITNSTFTKAAKELANKNNVRLIDGHDLEQFNSIVCSFATLQ
jgi:restriction system protein